MDHHVRGSGRRIRCLLLLSLPLLLLLVGCGGPFMAFPGGALRGEEVTDVPDDWSFVDSSFMDLEVRPENPYSVTVNYIVKDGKLYIDPAADRGWYDYLKEDERVRVRFGFDDRVYPLRAVLVGGPGEVEGFDADRYIYRLEAR
jgi:hypothetical protein